MTVKPDSIFAFHVAEEIDHLPDPKSVQKAQNKLIGLNGKRPSTLNWTP